MQYQYVRGCAAEKLEDRTVADEALQHLQTNWRDAPGALSSVLACRDDVDGLAAFLITWLGDDALSDQAIAQFHHYPQARTPTEFDARIRDIYDAAQSRPDVREAFDRVGRVLDVPSRE